MAVFSTDTRAVSIRLKVTEKCPWSCKFCHKEGGWAIEDVKWNQETVRALTDLKNATGANEIHYTGGEPSTLQDLDRLSSGFTDMGFRVKTTTNGQFSEKRLKRLIKNGLCHYNFSVLSFDPEILFRTQETMGYKMAARAVERQRRIIQLTATLDAFVKINTVITDEMDFPRAMAVYSYAKKRGIPIRFLNDLNNKAVAEKAVTAIARDVIGAERVKTVRVYGSSSMTTHYRDRDGYDFGVKGICPNRIPALCSDCTEDCREGFYGIRLEKRDGTFYVRLCIHRQDEKSVMPLEIFLRSTQLRQINERIQMN